MKKNLLLFSFVIICSLKANVTKAQVIQEVRIFGLWGKEISCCRIHKYLFLAKAKG